jgi:hypothetical protein
VSSRKQIAIKEVRDGIIILPNHEARLIIETSSVNFELKSEEEQDVLIDAFQNFLNSLPCKLQILIRIREMDIDQYIGGIKSYRQKETESVYLQELDAYTSFIRELVSGNKILSRKFYIVIPFKSDNGSKDFDLIKQQLLLTRDLVSKSLDKLGMKATPLDSLQTLNLFYSFYNKGQIKTQELKGEAIKNLLGNNYA